MSSPSKYSTHSNHMLSSFSSTLPLLSLLSPNILLKIQFNVCTCDGGGSLDSSPGHPLLGKTHDLLKMAQKDRKLQLEQQEKWEVHVHLQLLYRLSGSSQDSLHLASIKPAWDAETMETTSSFPTASSAGPCHATMVLSKFRGAPKSCSSSCPRVMARVTPIMPFSSST